MEETQNEQENVVNPVTPITPPPMAPRQPKRNLGIIILGAVLLVIIIVVGVFVVRSSGTQSTASPTPQTEGLSSPASPTPSGTPVDKSTVSILIQNGTGIAGEAAYLQGVLTNAGYTNISTGNADTSDNTDTSVTYSATLDKSVSDDITQTLSGIYQTVDTNTSSSQTQDVVIVTGLRKGQTPAPSATPTPEESPTESPIPSPT